MSFDVPPCPSPIDNPAAWCDAAATTISNCIALKQPNQRYWAKIGGYSALSLVKKMTNKTRRPEQEVLDAAVSALASDARFISGMAAGNWTLSVYASMVSRASAAPLPQARFASGPSSIEGVLPLSVPQGSVATRGGARGLARAGAVARPDMVAALIAAADDGGAASFDAPTYGDFVDGEGASNSVLGGEIEAETGMWDPEMQGCISDGRWTSYFLGAAEPAVLQPGGRCSVAVGAAGSTAFRESALLGAASLSPASALQPVYLNTHEPFVFVTVGVQGSGKSHTLSCVLESCLLPFPGDGIVTLAQPHAALVLHYDQSPQSICEATGLVLPDAAVARRDLEFSPGLPPPALPRDRMLILVSPTFYQQRRAFYGDHFVVKPLLLRWRSLTADHIKRIMRIHDDDGAPLYVATMLNLLRRFQRAGVLPSYADFIHCVTAECDVKGQNAPLVQRLKLLTSIVAESTENADLVALGGDVETTCEPGRLVVIDLTDPLLSASEANGIFHVALEKFRALPLRCGKVLALDEAHKYMTSGDGLSHAIVNLARLVRHDGLRLIVSTQSPLALAPELLELVTIGLLHRFHSRDWHLFLSKKLALSDDTFERITQLNTGEGLLFAARALDLIDAHAAPHQSAGRVLAPAVFKIQVRRRITADRGTSRLNRAATVP